MIEIIKQILKSMLISWAKKKIIKAEKDLRKAKQTINKHSNEEYYEDL